MTGIIIAFPNAEDGRRIQNILIRHGFEAASVCTNASQVFDAVSQMEAGLVICGYRLKDMHCTQLRECLPKGFEMLLIASAAAVSPCSLGFMALTLPLKTYDLVNTVQMMTSQIVRAGKKKRPRRVRSEQERKIIGDAKQLLMERNHLSEEEAHRYLQKQSMDMGRSMLETAQMILTLMDNE